MLASSGESKHVDHYLDLLDGRRLAEAWTTSDDAEQTKPAPDLVETAMAKVEGVHAVMIGDSVWDAKAAKRAGLPTYSPCAPVGSRSASSKTPGQPRSTTRSRTCRPTSTPSPSERTRSQRGVPVAGGG